MKLIISQRQISFFFAFILLAKEDKMVITVQRGKVPERSFFLKPELKCPDFYIKCQKDVMET
jgi:hypothetical protein